MECIVLISSVQKTGFSNDEKREKFTLDIISGIREIIINSQGLDDQDNYNEFCRLLFRFRATVPLNQTANVPGYMEWMELVADFSLKAFQSWKFAPNTSMYVMGFWSRTVKLVNYSKDLDGETITRLQNISINVGIVLL
jgi:exportin-7